MRDYRVINTSADLLEFLYEKPSVFDSIPPLLLAEIADEAVSIFAFYAMAVQRGYCSVLELSNLIDFDTCEELVLNHYLDMLRIPYPEYPVSGARTHYVDISTTETSVEVAHNLGREEYAVDVLYDDATHGISKLPADEYTIKKLMNSVVITNPSARDLQKVLFVYRRDYVIAKRLLCHAARDLNGMRYTQIGLVYYLRLLLNNYCAVSLAGAEASEDLFQFLSWNDPVGNFDNAKLFNYSFVVDGLHSFPVTTINLVDPLRADIPDTTVIQLSNGDTITLSAAASETDTTLTVVTTTVDIADGVTALTPGDITALVRMLDVAGPSETTTLDLFITADLDDDIKAFITDAIVDYFLPFPEVFEASLTIDWTDYTNEW